MRCDSRRLILMGLFFLLLSVRAGAQQQQKLVLNHTDELEVVLENGRYVTYVNGNVDFQTETGHVYCDSAVFLRGRYANLRGNVFIDEEEYMLRSDSAFYDIENQSAIARGQRVELWSYADSLYGVGVHAFYDRGGGYFYMEDRPVVYLGYPDTAQMVEVIADFIDYRSETKRAEAIGNVVITSKDMKTESGCAVVNLEKNVLDLYQSPVAQRERSTIRGEFISVGFADQTLNRIDVIDSAYGEFTEPIDSAETDFDRSILSGGRIAMEFTDGDLSRVTSFGQAYSWYYPSLRGGREFHENSVSGDTIRFDVENDELQRVTVKGGARGTYITGKVKVGADLPPKDTVGDSTSVADTAFTVEPPRAVETGRADTINYRAELIKYDLDDSLIVLETRGEVQSGRMALKAHEVEFKTAERMVEASSAEIDPDQQDLDFYNMAARLQPATIPVILKDGTDELYGDYLEYSIDTEKGRIVKSKSEFEQGFYYGQKLFRERDDVYYVEDGYFTTCDADEPHFHFHSSRMKLMENNKLIARPVVFYIGRIPLLAIPYYVFPLQKGRHSGFLPFTFGRFEQGERYVRNVGYYWAPSDYYDLLGALDYHEQNRTITFKSRFSFARRYVLDGYVAGEYRRQTAYNSSVARESATNTWSLRGAYNHKISPTFQIRSTGDYQSSSTHYEFSNSLEERLNRELKSTANFSKRWGDNTSLSGSVQHTENLDNETRTDYLPNLSLSLPTIFPFGSGSTDPATGQTEKHWYNNFTLRYNPSLLNYSTRRTIDSVFVRTADTSFVVDTLTGEVLDTTILVLEADTVSYRTRREYARISHNPGISLPAIRFGNYMTIVPSFSYAETWFKIFETDQSRAAGIDASQLYRTYSYSARASASTKLYGTIYPNVAGLVGLRHVFEPSVSYSWSPEINRHPTVRSYAGGGAGSLKSSTLGFSVKNTFQAKVGGEGMERNLELLSLNSSFGYDFEREERPLSNMTTSFFTSTLPRVNIHGAMTHTFYDPRTGEENLLSPWLLSFNVNVSFQITGQTFFFNESGRIPRGADSVSELSEQIPDLPRGAAQGWNLAVTYSFSESGLHSNFYNKSSFLDFTLGFGLTPSTSVNYRQHYDVVRQETISNSVSVVRQLHCWTGSLYWVPIGSNRGFGFKLNVTDLPDIKLESGHDSFISSDVLRR